MRFSRQIQVPQLPPHKKGKEILNVTLIYASVISLAAPGGANQNNAGNLEMTSPASAPRRVVKTQETAP